MQTDRLFLYRNLDKEVQIAKDQDDQLEARSGD